MSFRFAMLMKYPIRHRPWCLADSYDFIAYFVRRSDATQFHIATYTGSTLLRPVTFTVSSKHYFHNYFLTNLPSSLHSYPSSAGPLPKLSYSASSPNASTSSLSSATGQSETVASRELTVVRIPLQSAKQHFGVSQSRGTRPSNEDTYQAGTIDIPAFAKRTSISLSNGFKSSSDENNISNDPQVFCFGVFDGHGGNECSIFLKENLHDYVEKTAGLFRLRSSLLKSKGAEDSKEEISTNLMCKNICDFQTREISEAVKKSDDLESNRTLNIKSSQNSMPESKTFTNLASKPLKGEEVLQLVKSLVKQWKDTVGGYFRRFKPEYFDLSSNEPTSIESVLMYAFLKADLDFVSAQAHKPEYLGKYDHSLDHNNLVSGSVHSMFSNSIGGPTRFVGGSTASIALISTPTSTPFWHPNCLSTMIVAHVGDTRIILCDTGTGLAKPCTTNHHPSSPSESNRLRRYATTFITDSFGEERMSGLANTRSFGDMHSKRIGVSAEPEIHRIELAPAEYSMLVLVSDGVSGTLSDQEIVDVIKEANTPEQGARDVVGFATEISKNGDNATCLVVRLGGWERRREGGVGSLGTKEGRDWRRGDASDMRKVECHR